MPNLDIPRTTRTIPQSFEGRSRVALAPVDSLPKGQGRCFSIGRLKVAVFRDRDDRIFAIDAMCPHRDGPLADGLVGDGTVVCPLHAYRFRLHDGSGVETELRVRAYPVEIHDGCIVLSLPRAD
jgi:nitrite reductase (NADH) small subunit